MSALGTLRVRTAKVGRPDVRDRVGVWWLSPVALVSLIALPTTWLALLIPDDRYRALWGTPKSVSLGWTVWFTVGLLLFVAGGQLVRGLRPLRPLADWPVMTDPDYRVLERAAKVLFWLTMVGYVAYLVNVYRVGLSIQFLFQTLIHQDFYDAGIRERLTTVPGLTTMTQFGVAFVVVTGTLLVARRGSRAQHLRRLGVVFFLALLRAFFVSERLALLELLVPLMVVLVTGLSRSTSGARRAAFLPAVLLPVVVAIFAAFEYSRSWVFYAAHGGDSFPTFVVERFAGYYVTAYNNGEIRLLHQPDTTLPYDLLQAFWTAPGVGNLFTTLTGVDEDGSYTEALTKFGNPEFNNQGGVISPFVDLGTGGALVFYALAGIACGLLYRSLRESRIWGVLLYPVVALTLMELPRYPYLFQGRAAPGLIALVVVALALQRSRRRRIEVLQ